MKELFTYIFDFRGGTYITQIEALGLNDSVNQWIDKIDSQTNKIQFLGKMTTQEIKNNFNIPENRHPSPLNGLSNVWCLTVQTRQGLGIINIIKTVKHL